MASLTGLTSEEFTDIDVLDTIAINGNIGTAGQVLTSDGTLTNYADVTAPPAADILGAGTGISITTTGNPETISTNVKSLVLSGSGVTSSPQTFNPNANGGSQTITINDTDTQLALAEGSGITITNLGGLNRRIAANIDADTINFDGDELSVSKVPNDLTAGTNISFSSGTTYDGSAAITISSADTNTQLNLTEGNGISITNTGGVNRTIAMNADGSTLNSNVGSGQAGVIKVPNALTAGTGISFNSGTTYDGSAAKTISASAPLPTGVFDVGGDLRMTINLANFMTNDDSTYYNVISEDDGSSKIHGAIKPANAVVELVGYFVIPSGYEASAARVDVTDSGGSGVTRDLTFESFTTYGGTTFADLGDGPTGSEQAFDVALAGASDKLLLIKIDTTATTDHVRGGYIVIEES
tara:strand:+ start:980 stop:2215 length:1236 start_codon:yes stop_codon:yes gene_type:complete